MAEATNEQHPEISLAEAQDRIAIALRGLRFGAVEIQVHDSRIVRITRTEKVRVERVEVVHKK
jgi:hypothetical protein